jgi:hypothetical protein
MKVIDLPTGQVGAYCQCLEEWSPEIREAGGRKLQWYEHMKDHGLRVEVSLDDERGVVMGHGTGPRDGIPAYKRVEKKA